MTTWDPGDGGPDLLSSGSEDTPWAGRFRTLMVGVVCLAAGAFLGARWEDVDLPFAAQAAAPPAVLSGGTLTAVVDPDQPRSHSFEVGLFNSGEGNARVLVSGLVGSSTPVTTSPPEDVPSMRWAHVAFSLPGVCEPLTMPRITAIRVRLVGPGPTEERLVELAEPAVAVQEHRDRACTAPTVLDPGQLTGLWSVEEYQGRWQELAGVTLMRFTSDGRFALDPEGRMFVAGGQGFFGTFRIHGSLLHLDGDGGYACAAGYSEVWRTTLLEEDRLQLEIVRSDGGYCNTPPGDRQVLRRLVPERRLPPLEPSASRETAGN